MKQISLEEARALAIYSQALHPEELPSGKAGVRQVISQIGYVQIDTISVIERAHHHVLWSRVPNYQATYLRELEEEDRAVFEYWAHAASYLPMESYRFTLPRKTDFLKGKEHWFKRDRKNMAYVLDRIRSEGPLMSKDFKPAKKNKSTSNGMDWARNPMNLALRQLFMEGQLMVSHRRGFQKVYDLPENILPSDLDTSMPDQEAYYSYLINRDITAHGLVKSREIAYLIKGSGKAVNELLKKMEDTGEIVGVKIAGMESDTYYTRPDLLEQLARIKISRKLRILSPFDNLVIQRQRLDELFSFKYVLECYVPAAKRQFGYFSLPLLWGTSFAGQVDLKADRKNKVLLIRKLEWDRALKHHNNAIQGLTSALSGFAAFNACEKLEIAPDLRAEYGALFT